MNLFDTLKMIDHLEQTSPPVGHFLSKFFTRTTFETEKIGVEVRKRGREAASFVSPLHDAVTVQAAGTSVTEYKPAYISEQMVTTANDLLTRTFGEMIGGSKTPAQRAGERLAAELDELSERQERRYELMAIEAMVDAKQTIIGEGVNEALDFGRDASLVYTLAKKFNASDADVFAAIHEMCQKVLLAGGHPVTDVYLGADAADAFLQRVGTSTQLDIRRYNAGSVEPRPVERGLVYLGHIARDNVNVWQYTDWVKVDGVLREVFPAKKMVGVAGGAKRTFGFGVIRHLDASAAVEKFPYQFQTPNGKLRFLVVDSSPLAVPVEVDTTATVTVLT